MGQPLVVRVFKVRFGDAILISIPDRDASGRETLRHILIDVGNADARLGEGGADSAFEPVLKGIKDIIGETHIDLYVMSHEHLDHVQGLLYGKEKLGITLPIDRVWLTASAHPDYYKTHEDARKKKELAQQALAEVADFAAASRESLAPEVLAMLAVNDSASTKKCVDYLRSIAPQETTYVHREADLTGKHPFSETRLSIWAPEEDTADYYGRFQPINLGITVSTDGKTPEPVPTTVTPPAGVDAGAFYDLVQARADGFADNLLTIDRAGNNTSVVLCIEWRGWRLLFTGDAEQRSWKTMNKNGMLRPVHFLKVGHHGSWNGSPPAELLAKILPTQAPDGRPRLSAVSTYPNTYSSVPDKETTDAIGKLALLRSTVELPNDGECLTFEFADPEATAPVREVIDTRVGSHV